MPKIQILGSASGTEPILNHHHTSVVISVGGDNYFFDAGENSSRLAHLGGVDLLNTRAVFISHVHYDHIGGLAGVFWNIKKLCSRKKSTAKYTEIPLFIPDIRAWCGISDMLLAGDAKIFKNSFSVVAKKPCESLIYEDENIKVFAYGTHHMPPFENGEPRSFSYRIEFDGFSMVYSGDVGSADDLVLPVGCGCDLLLAETGHHKVKSICDFADSHAVGELVFYHHGREILNSMPSVKEALDACSVKTTLASDGLVIER